MSSFWETLTLETVKSLQREEFIKKYRHCFLFIQKDKDSEPVLAYFNGDEDGGYYTFTGKKDVKFCINHDTKAVVSASFPTPKLINFEKHFFYFCRIPARQYRKAPCNDNCNAYNPISSIVPYSNGEISLELIEEAFNPIYPSFYDAIAELQTGEVLGRAVNELFAISQHPNSDDKLLLWIETTPVAEIVGKEIEVKVEIFRQEIVDFINRNSISYYVK